MCLSQCLKVVVVMSKAIVRIHRPNLTEEEKKIREERIKNAIVQFYKETRFKEDK